MLAQTEWRSSRTMQGNGHLLMQAQPEWRRLRPCRQGMQARALGRDAGPCVWDGLGQPAGRAWLRARPPAHAPGLCVGHHLDDAALVPCGQAAVGAEVRGEAGGLERALQQAHHLWVWAVCARELGVKVERVCNVGRRVHVSKAGCMQ